MYIIHKSRLLRQIETEISSLQIFGPSFLILNSNRQLVLTWLHTLHIDIIPTHTEILLLNGVTSEFATIACDGIHGIDYKNTIIKVMEVNVPETHKHRR